MQITHCNSASCNQAHPPTPRAQCLLICLAFLATLLPANAQTLSLQSVVTPSTVITKDAHPVTFALHGFIEFQSLADAFPYIQSQAQRWPGRPDDQPAASSPANFCAAPSKAASSP